MTDEPNDTDDADDLSDEVGDGATDEVVDDDTDDDDVDESDDDDLDEEGDDVADGLPRAKAVCEFVVRQLVEYPDDVSVDLDERGRTPRLNVTVAPGDVGRVIGRRGRVASSIRTLVRAAASRDGAEVEVEFLD